MPTYLLQNSLSEDPSLPVNIGTTGVYKVLAEILPGDGASITFEERSSPEGVWAVVAGVALTVNTPQATINLLEGQQLRATRVDGAGEVTVTVGLLTPLEPTPEPDATTITAEGLAELALNPKRTTTEEGTLEERDMQDIILADQYASSKAASQVPWGMKIAKIKPSGTL